MKNKVLKYLLLSGCLMVLFSACRKDSFKGTETGSSGKTYLWISEAGGDPYVQYFDVFTDVKPVVLFTVRRDAASAADLKKSVSVTLTADPDSTANVGLTAFAAGTYSLPTSADVAAGGIYASAGGVTQTATGFTVTFAPGEFAKTIVFKVDGSKLDLSNTYGGVYKITGSGGLAVKSGFDVVATGVAVKNKYDGQYSVSGTIYRDADVTLGGPYASTTVFSLATVGPNDVAFSLLWAPGDSEVGGVNPINLHIDPVTNQVTATSVANGTLMNIPGADNYYDPATKAFHLNFVWNGTDPAHRSVSVVLTYAGPR